MRRVGPPSCKGSLSAPGSPLPISNRAFGSADGLDLHESCPPLQIRLSRVCSHTGPRKGDPALAGYRRSPGPIQPAAGVQRKHGSPRSPSLTHGHKEASPDPQVQSIWVPSARGGEGSSVTDRRAGKYRLPRDTVDRVPSGRRRGTSRASARRSRRKCPSRREELVVVCIFPGFIGVTLLAPHDEHGRPGDRTIQPTWGVGSPSGPKPQLR